ncbi:MAG: serine O-acetyltransferase [Clostridia bacterium]
MFITWKNDIKCVRDRDPACRNTLEVLLCYPGFRAVRSYRFAHFLYRHGMKLIARMVSELCRFFTGVEIHPAAIIGQRMFIDHGMGVVIGETSIVGDDVTLYQGATLGGTGKEIGKRHPTVGNHVTVSAGASVLGPVMVGDHSKIGAGAVVLRNVPRFATVVGVPGHVVRMNGCSVVCGENCNCDSAVSCPRDIGKEGEAGVDLDQVHLPDPVEQQIQALLDRIEWLEKTVHAQQRSIDENGSCNYLVSVGMGQTKDAEQMPE